MCTRKIRRAKIFFICVSKNRMRHLIVFFALKDIFLSTLEDQNNNTMLDISQLKVGQKHCAQCVPLKVQCLELGRILQVSVTGGIKFNKNILDIYMGWEP